MCTSNLLHQTGVLPLAERCFLRFFHFGDDDRSHPNHGIYPNIHDNRLLHYTRSELADGEGWVQGYSSRCNRAAGRLSHSAPTISCPKGGGILVYGFAWSPRVVEGDASQAEGVWRARLLHDMLFAPTIIVRPHSPAVVIAGPCGLA